MNTHAAAEKMLSTGLFYNDLLLGREFGCSAKHGARCIKNICANPRYQVVIEQNPIKRVKVTAIDGRTMTIDKLQNTALLFKRPSLLIGETANAL